MASLRRGPSAALLAVSVMTVAASVVAACGDDEPGVVPVAEATTSSSTTTTLASTSTVGPTAATAVTDPCAGPSPPADVWAVAGPGGGATELVTFVVDERAMVQGFVEGGVTNAVDLEVLDPVLAEGRIDLHARVDLDGDGRDELVLGGFGNTARTARILTLDGCRLALVHDADTGAPFELLVGIGGGSCAPIGGCSVTITCTAGDIEHTVVHPDEHGVAVLETTVYRLEGDEMHVRGGYSERPAHSPEPDTDDAVC